MSAGTVDAYSEAFSVGVRNPGDQMLMYGSTMFLVQIIDEYHSDPTLWTTTGVDSGSLALAAGTSTAGSLIGWLQGITGGASFDDLMAEAQSVPPGSDGLLVLPYFAGERTPVFDPQARGVVAGLTLRHGRGHLFRAAYEGIAVRHPADPRAVRRRPHRNADGGCRRRTAQPDLGAGGQRRHRAAQLVPEQAIGASYGDALLAAIGVGSGAARHRLGEDRPGDQAGPAATAISTRTCTRRGVSCTRPPRISCTGSEPADPA